MFLRFYLVFNKSYCNKNFKKRVLFHLWEIELHVTASLRFSKVITYALQIITKSFKQEFKNKKIENYFLTYSLILESMTMCVECFLKTNETFHVWFFFIFFTNSQLNCNAFSSYGGCSNGVQKSTLSGYPLSGYPLKCRKLPSQIVRNLSV